MPGRRYTYHLKKDVIPKLMKAAGVRTNAELAKFLGITPQNIWNAKDKSKIPVGWVMKIHEKTGKSVEEIIKEEINVGAELGPSALQQTARSMVGDGDSVVAESRVPYGLSTMKGSRKYRILLDMLQEWVDEVFPVAQRPGLVSWVIDSDNMEPSLPMNSMVLIDTNQTNIMAAGIYAFQASGYMTFRRLNLRPDGNIDVVNDNKAYPSQSVPPKSLLESAEMKIIGRVIFKGNKI